MRVRRGLILVPVAVALALLAAACGSQSVLQRDVVASAAARTADAGSSRVAFEVKASPLGNDVTVRGQGAFDYDASRGRLELDASVLSGGPIEVRIVDSKLFVRTPAALAWVPGVKPWVAVGDGRSLDAYGLGELQQDPGQLLSLLRASSTKVTKTGTAVVRGTETTRYVAQLELTKALEANADHLGLTATERAALRRLAEELRGSSTRQTLPVVVFVDDEGLVRRLTLRDADGSVSVDFWDFGADVDVQAPPAGDVTDASDLLQP